MGDGHSSLLDVKGREVWRKGSGNGKFSTAEVWCQGWGYFSIRPGSFRMTTEQRFTAWSLERKCLIPVPTCHHSWRNFFISCDCQGHSVGGGLWTVKRSAVSCFESRSLNVTNRKVFFLSMLLDLSLNLDCHAIKSGPWETRTQGERRCRRPKRCVSDRAMNQPAHSQLLSRKQMPGREQPNLGRDIHRSEQVKTWGQPEGRLNKDSKMQRKILWKHQVMTVVGLCGVGFIDKHCLCLWRARRKRFLVQGVVKMELALTKFGRLWI